MQKAKPNTLQDILEDNLRICRMILNFSPGDNLIGQCRAALRENIRNYDRLVLTNQEKARERKGRKKSGSNGF